MHEKHDIPIRWKVWKRTGVTTWRDMCCNNVVCCTLSLLVRYSKTSAVCSRELRTLLYSAVALSLSFAFCLRFKIPYPVSGILWRPVLVSKIYLSYVKSRAILGRERRKNQHLAFNRVLTFCKFTPSRQRIKYVLRWLLSVLNHPMEFTSKGSW